MSLPRYPPGGGLAPEHGPYDPGEVHEPLDYLQEHGRAAALPDVRHGIQISRHFPDMSEVRVGIDDTRL